MNEIAPKVSIVIVTWNSEKDILDCLKSISDQDYQNIDSIIVIDNNSSDNTVSIIEENFPGVELIKSEKNTFFTGGHNLGINYAIEKYDSKYVLIVNPDTYSPENLLSELVNTIESDPTIGIVGPKIKFWNNSNEGKINSAGMIYDGFMQVYDRGFLEENYGQYNKIEEVPAVTGCCMLLRSLMIKETGAFFEPLKTYLEDLELCLRVRKKSWKIIYDPNVEVGHKWMQSTNQNKHIQLENWKIRNWLYIALRHYSFLKKLIVLKKFIEFRISPKNH